MLDVIGLGAVAVDDFLYVAGYPPANSKVRVVRTDRQCGGLAATALAAVARLGGRCAYAGVLGTDELSDFALSRMRELGIDLGHVHRRPEARCIHSVVVVDETGSRNIFFDLNGFVGAGDEWPPAELIHGAAVLLVDHIGVPGMIRAASIARAAGVPVVGDVENATHRDFNKLLELIDHLIVPESFALQLTGQTALPEALRRLACGRRVAAATCGEAGCFFIDETGDVKHQPAFVVKSVDTTGCGDVFHGAYAFALARQMDLGSRMLVASAAAALKATQPGGQKGIPDAAGVEAFLDAQSTGGDGGKRIFARRQP